ncbi:MoaD/ThiS family protein [Pseudomonas mosselii]|uniref:MoaD/ThiS family protein n=1 Tax=Pseudomonas mosselii TaxID=78327 RepID=UPI000BB50FAE|nr:MoaD/ThiS family protein [Pseudomonas mosselii]ATB66322.1 molybdopterin synthase sulfur carrier subunit [Pseudomonas mosselii]MDH1102969.1 MoaD/ThiS family protein [Pseudomonas mosselii]MEA3236781.1 MoaD/ThiS family protein [Pseudomonas mosselii]MEB5931040.1 MoaD/ThiS family protein [Pseudomonas mosselii]UVN43585.1 MoaD/ThiS family protein [Pseudomonas mosselii]
MKVHVVFFARYRELLGSEAKVLEGDFTVLEDVLQALIAKGGGYEVLREQQSLMCARNQELCKLHEPVEDGDEVAFFPPVTGG